MQRTIKLMAEYESWPLWDMTDGQYFNIAPDSLPISADLVRSITEWAEAYEATLDPEDPMESGFDTPEDEKAFDEQGRKLWRSLRAEMFEADVVYYRESEARMIRFAGDS